MGHGFPVKNEACPQGKILPCHGPIGKTVDDMVLFSRAEWKNEK